MDLNEPLAANEKLFYNCDLNNNNHNDGLTSLESVIDCDSDFSVDWYNVNYHIYPTLFDRAVNCLRRMSCKSGRKLVAGKTILRNLNGSFKSGKLSAIMGPSGSGKSTLIECLAGIRRNGLEGKIMLTGRSKISKAFIPQQDELHNLLTVRESLMYSYELKFSSRMASEGYIDRYETASSTVDHILKQLNLVDCCDVLIDCISGGQKKRTSIAQELVSKPDVLLIDEPTSGLDSSTCYSMVKLLQQIALQSSIAVIITIHQPSARTFNLLHEIYMLSSTGRLLYSGLPEQVIPILTSVNLKLCPFNNPADVLIEIAYGDYGFEVNNRLANLMESKFYSHNQHIQCNDFSTYSRNNSFSSQSALLLLPTSRSLSDCKNSHRGHFTVQLKILLSRQLTLTKRNPLLSSIRIFFALSVAVLLGGMYSGKGIYDGCIPDIGEISLDKVDTIRTSIETNFINSKDNSGSFYFLLIFLGLTNLMLPVAVVPRYMKLYRKEYFNSWYQTGPYFVALNLADLPLTILSNFISVTGLFILTSQPMDRYYQCLFIFLLVSVISSTHGFIIGTIFMDDLMTSVFTGPSTFLPLLLFSGFFTRIDQMPITFQLLSSISYFKYAFQAYSIAIFSERCKPEAIRSFDNIRGGLDKFLDTMFTMAGSTLKQLSEGESLINKTMKIKSSLVNGLTDSWFNQRNQSAIFDYYSLFDVKYSSSIAALIVTLIVGQLIAFLVTKWRVNV